MTQGINQRRDLAVLVLGSVLLLAYAAQAQLDVTWSLLENAQADDTYKLVTGIGLVLYLKFQLSARRRVDPARALFRHRVGGALAPAVLYLHSTKIGYGYLVLLCAIYLGTTLAGVLHQPVLALRSRRLYTTWFIVHVTLAITLIVIAAYHVGIALAYE